VVTPQAVPGLPGQAQLSQLTALVKTRLRRVQYRPGLLGGFSPAPGSISPPLSSPTINDL
jgi:hypothetical protein